MEFDYQIRRLSTDFFNAYPESVFPEILRKEQRPYYCLVVDIHEDYFICIPYRSNLSQKLSNKQGFKFVNSRRSRQSPSGLDYRKIRAFSGAGDSGCTVFAYIDEIPVVLGIVVIGPEDITEVGASSYFTTLSFVMERGFTPNAATL